MARATKVGVEYGLKVNLGNYHSATVSVSVWLDLDEGDRAGTMIDQARGLCRAKVEEEVRRLAPADPTNVSTDKVDYRR